MERNRPKIPVGILGATGKVGRQFAALLKRHPWFDLVAVTASEHSVGAPFDENLTLSPTLPDLPCRLVFSALDASVAGEVEERFARAGYTVVSNARNFRLHPDVPLVVPEINASTLALALEQPFSGGSLITCPNCSTVGITMALKPLHDAFGIEALHVVTLQAISGAGRAIPDIEDNVIPYIALEEEKIEQETKKILQADFPISATCTRVPVSDGHLACVSVKLAHRPSLEEVIEAWESFPGLKGLPSAPLQPLHFFEEAAYPQPRLHRDLEGGMAVSIGRLRRCPLLGYKFILLSHNTLRGAAGGAVLTAEAFVGTPFAFPPLQEVGYGGEEKEGGGAPKARKA